MKKTSIILLLLYVSRAVCFHELCAKRPFQNVDCKKQLWHDDSSSDVCTVKYYVTNSSECSQINFKSDLDTSVHLGDVHIKPFLWDYKNSHIYYYTLFNVTFSNIKWNHIKFRFESKGINSKEYKNHCREIFIQSNETLRNTSSLLSYDCHWSDQDRRYENEKYYLEYEAEGSAGVARGKFIFIVPSIDTLAPVQSHNDWVPFVYLNVMDPKNILIHIVPPDESLRVDSYILEVCLQVHRSPRKKNICEKIFVKHIPLQEVTHLHKMQASGRYTFEVTPVSSDCPESKCKSVFGPEIHIDLHQESIVYTILWIVLVFSILWIPVILWLAFKWRVSKRYQPNVLIIHPPGNKMDAEVVDLLAKYFKCELQWKLLLKEDIKSTNHDNPYLWCVDAFNKADVILYIVNPYTKDQSEVEYAENNIYTNLDQILLKYIRSGQAKCPVVNVLFDHYKVRQIPRELTHMKTYRLLKDWYQLLYYVMGYNFWDRLNRPIPKLQNSESGRELCTFLDV